MQADTDSKQQQQFFSLGCTLSKVCNVLGLGQRAADTCCLQLGIMCITVCALGGAGE
jgi:hypothetical protein